MAGRKRKQKSKYKKLDNYYYNPVNCVDVITYPELLKYAVTGKLPQGKRFGMVQIKHGEI